MAEKKKELHSFMISFDSETLVKYLAPDQKAQLLDALYDYAIRGNKRDFSGNPLLMASYEMMTKTIDENKQKYDDKCLKNSANQKLRHLYDDFQKSKDRGLPTIQIEQAIRNICDEYEISIRPDIFKQMGVSTNVDERIQKDTISTNTNTDRNRNTDIKGNRNTDRESDRESDTESYPDINQQTDRQTESKEIPAVDNSSASVDSDGRTAWNEIVSFLLDCGLGIPDEKITSKKEVAITGIMTLIDKGYSLEDIKSGILRRFKRYKRSDNYSANGWKYMNSLHVILTNKIDELEPCIKEIYEERKKKEEFENFSEEAYDEMQSLCTQIYKGLKSLEFFNDIKRKFQLCYDFKLLYFTLHKLVISGYEQESIKKCTIAYYAEHRDKGLAFQPFVCGGDLQRCLDQGSYREKYKELVESHTTSLEVSESDKHTDQAEEELSFE